MDWLLVVHVHDLDEDGNCPLCMIDYAECECPGPMQEGYEYEELNGVLYARKVTA